MASRKSQAKAQELIEKMQANFPDATFRIVDNSATQRIGRIVAEEDGLEIVEDNGGIMVTARVSRFDVLEARICHSCGSEFLTRAIGEHGPTCKTCRDSSAINFNAELKTRIAQKQEQSREREWRNNHEE